MTGASASQENFRGELSFRVTMTGFQVCLGRRLIGWVFHGGFMINSGASDPVVVLTPAELHAIANKVGDVFQTVHLDAFKKGAKQCLSSS